MLAYARKGATEMAHHTPVEAEQLKRARATGTASAHLAAVKTWHCTTFPTCAAASTWLNLPPAQLAGEAFATDDEHGHITLFFFL
jgi:hypothetical protein